MRNNGPATAGMGSFVYKNEFRSEIRGKPSKPGPWLGLLGHYLKALGMPEASASILICGDARSRSLNLAWRGKDRATDVLSFPLNEGKIKKGFKGPLGDIVVNFSYAKRHRGRFAGSLQGELGFLLLHGLLHLAGYHHDTPRQEAAMWRLSKTLFPPPSGYLKGFPSMRAIKKDI
jgi:probable rRNA maturation factor